MNSSRSIISLTVIICTLIIAIPTFYKVITEHNRKLNIVTNKMIIEAAQDCYYDNKCQNTKITLEELYNQGYLSERVINPVTKEVYADNSYVILKKEDSKFHAL
jgi:competence protein ComGC